MLAVNQNPEKSENGEFTLPAGKVFDLNSQKEVTDKKVSLSLAPGDGIYWYCGDDFAMLDDAFRSRFATESARYLLLADRAAGDGIAVTNPDNFAKLPPKKALEALLAERKALEERIAKAPLGKVLEDMEKVRSMLDKADFRLCQAKALTITPEMRQKTPKYSRWTAHCDSNFNRIRERMAKTFAHYYRLLDAIDNGEGSKTAANELPALLKEADEAVTEVNSWLDNHPERAKMDDPYSY